MFIYVGNSWNQILKSNIAPIIKNKIIHKLPFWITGKYITHWFDITIYPLPAFQTCAKFQIWLILLNFELSIWPARKLHVTWRNERHDVLTDGRKNYCKKNLFHFWNYLQPSDKWTFGQMNLRTDEPSERWTFGQMNLRTGKPSDKWTFGQMNSHRDRLCQTLSR